MDSSIIQNAVVCGGSTFKFRKYILTIGHNSLLSQFVAIDISGKPEIYTQHVN